MARRRLTPEDREAWDRVRASAQPLRPEAPLQEGRRAEPALPPVPLAPVPGPPLAQAPPARPFRVGAGVGHRGGHDLLPGLAQGLAARPLRMDAGTFGRMARGKVRPEARLDLHGLTLAEAHGALLPFIQAAHADGRRLVLVITGKGRLSDDLAPMPARAGRLRHDVPRWLGLPPLVHLVLQVAPAHRRHGGEGAVYVYLRGR